MKCSITYRCGHQKEDFVYASEEYIPARLAEYARQLCYSCQVTREQQQFEEAIQQAHEVYNVTDQNGHFLTATGFAQKVHFYCDFLGKRRFYPKSQFTPIVNWLSWKGF